MRPPGKGESVQQLVADAPGGQGRCPPSVPGHWGLCCRPALATEHRVERALMSGGLKWFSAGLQKEAG